MLNRSFNVFSSCVLLLGGAFSFVLDRSVILKFQSPKAVCPYLRANNALMKQEMHGRSVAAAAMSQAYQPFLDRARTLENLILSAAH